MFVRLNGKEVVVMPFDAATIYALLIGLVETLEYGFDDDIPLKAKAYLLQRPTKSGQAVYRAVKSTLKRCGAADDMPSLKELKQFDGKVFALAFYRARVLGDSCQVTFNTVRLLDQPFCLNDAGDELVLDR